MCGLMSDIITHLPDDVKETILTCLPLQDAARTSILSRKWRYMWMRLPQLVFDDMFCRESIRIEKNKLMMTIYQVLLLHCGPILKFTLSLSGLESCSEIDQLVLFVSDNIIQEFTLHIRKGARYKLPSSLFSCLQLKHLNLCYCMFKPPPEFEGFSSLLRLELCDVVITTDIFSSSISNCPLLEELTLEGCSSLDCLEIDARNLMFLRCKSHVRSVCFKNAPLLAKVSILLAVQMNEKALKEGETSNMVMFFDSLPVIQFLEINYYYVRYMAAGGISKRLPITLSHLTILVLYGICLGEPDEVSIVLCLIRSSPNLAKFKIEVYNDDPVELLEAQDWSDVSSNQLREVEMKNMSGTRCELEFIKLLLAKSPMLETVLIEPNLDKDVDKGLRILKELTRFRRLSPQAEITYGSL
ncbi:hypothetical protein CsSME_00022065 [Camellia sinensis var. sinensis]